MGNNKQLVDLDKKQPLKDIYRRNQYKIDDRFVLRDGKTHKCAILCPGGGYTLVCSFIEGTSIARKLNAMDISVFIVYYRVRKKAIYPNPQDDLARAVREISAKADEYHVDMTDYSVWGASAGGHLAGSFGTTVMGYARYQLPKPGAIVLSYPVITLEKDLTHQGTRQNHIGKKADEKTARKYSVQTNVDAAYPPTYIWCGDADGTVSPENTKMMEQALERNHIAHQCEIFPGVDHGVGPATGTAAENWIEHAVTFWKENMR